VDHPLPPRVGLVLGAGGLAGQAYHAGVLAAIEHHLGWDPREAEVIVGTSAGSLTGALLRSGVSAEDLARFAVDSPLTPAGQQLLAALGDQDVPELDPITWRDLLRAPGLPSPALLARLARNPRSFRAAALFGALAPAGRFELLEHLGPLADPTAEGWPERDLFLCAVRRRDGRRVVFGRPGAPEVPVATAVAASCAIPGWFRPVRIGGVDHVDGAVHSPTNGDVLRGRGLDVVIAVSPMSGCPAAWSAPDASVRAVFHRRLRQEAELLRSEGTTVVRFEPTARDLAVMGVNAMADGRQTVVTQQAFLSAGKRLGVAGVAQRLRPLDRTGFAARVSAA
jgi:NTE family protein